MKNILDHYLEFGPYTYPGPYLDLLKNELPSDIQKIGNLIRKQTIHRLVLENGNVHSNADKRYGDMEKIPKYRQAEDDIFPTATAMLSELFRRDSRGFVTDRAEKDRLIVTCRFVSILFCSILKSKEIPARVRSGFSPYFAGFGSKSTDHWIAQYWNKRWVNVDVDAILEDYLKFDPFDVPDGEFDFSADAWLSVRSGDVDADHFKNACGEAGLRPIAWELFYDFHSLMNNEIIYLHTPDYIYRRFEKLTEDEFKEIDALAFLMQKPDENFEKLKTIWETDLKFRLLKGGVI